MFRTTSAETPTALQALGQRPGSRCAASRAWHSPAPEATATGRLSLSYAIALGAFGAQGGLCSWTQDLRRPPNLQPEALKTARCASPEVRFSAGITAEPRLLVFVSCADESEATVRLQGKRAQGYGHRNPKLTPKTLVHCRRSPYQPWP